MWQIGDLTKDLGATVKFHIFKKIANDVVHTELKNVIGCLQLSVVIWRAI